MGLGTADMVLLVISLVASAGIGVYHGVKGLNQNSMDYLLGGRMMKPLPLAMSLTVSVISAITIMGNAGEMYAHGTQLWVMDVGIAIGMVFVAKCFIPIFYPLKMISLYHYIYSRFGSIWLRRSTVVLTLAGAYIFIGFLLYPPSLFLGSFTGLSTTANIIITGLVCSVYSSFGGVKAVVYTDVLQALIMIVGSLAIVMQGAANVGGLAKAWDIAYHHERIEFFNLDLDPYQRHSFWLVITYGFFFSVATYGVNQSQTQRAFSTSSVKNAQRVIYYAIVGMFLLRGLVNLSGVIIFANYAECDPLTKGSGPPQLNLLIVINYVTKYLTKISGLAGLFVASIYAAVLSSVSTQVNSMTALLWEDFLKGLPIFSSWNEVKITRLQKILVIITGIIGIFTSLLASTFSSFLKDLLQITGAVWGPMVGLFLVALYLPWVKFRGAALGFVIAIVLSIWIVIGQILTQPAAKFLPMSHEGCPPELNGLSPFNSSINFMAMNETVENLDTLTFNETKLVSDEIEEFGNKTPHSKLNRGVGFYGVSYCLNYCWGVITCILVAVLFTAFTSSNEPNDVEKNLIHPTAWKCFTKGIKPCMVEYVRQFLKSKETHINSREVESGTNKNEAELETLENTK